MVDTDMGRAGVEALGLTVEQVGAISATKSVEGVLKVVDAAAFALCMENKLPMIVFGMDGEGNIARVLRGEKIGTLVHAA